GTEASAPMSPPIRAPATSARSTASGWRPVARPTKCGARSFPSRTVTPAGDAVTLGPAGGWQDGGDDQRREEQEPDHGSRVTGRERSRRTLPAHRSRDVRSPA